MTGQIEQQRAQLRFYFENIIQNAKAIREEMKSMPHPRGVAYRSLAPKSGQAIVERRDGFTADYRDEQGNLYQIQIYQRDKVK